MFRISFSTLAVVLLISTFPAGRPCSTYAEEEREEDRDVYVPKDLDDCFAQLKKILKPEEIEKIKRGTEDGMSEYHFGLGMWMRNNWQLWKGGRLAKWFNEKGIRHPDDMSGIILDSFWRHLNSKPIELDRQIKKCQDYWKQAKIEDEREKERVKKAVERIRRMMMGISLGATPAPSVKIPNRQTDGLRARCLARFGNNVLIAVRTGPVETFTTPGYCLDLDKRRIHPIHIPEIDNQQYAVVAGGVAYFSGVTNGVPVLVAVDGKNRKRITPPETKVAPQLGIDGQNLLAVYRKSIYALQGTKWSEVYSGDIDLPKSGPPPRRFGDKIFFRDEGTCEDDKRLWWLELTKPHRLTSIDDDIGLVGPDGPRWEDSYSYCVTPQGNLWAAVGNDNSGESLVKRSVGGNYEIAVMNASLQFDGELLGSDDKIELPVSAVSLGLNGALLLAGNRGIYTLKERCAQQIVAFENVRGGPVGPNLPWHGLPSDILQLDENRYLISGVFGGIYLIERTASTGYVALPLDETTEKPLDF